MSRKWRFTAWGIYTLGCFLFLIIGFNWKVAIPISVIVGFICGLFNEIIHLLLKIYEHMSGKANES
jgi:ribose/xylose/arabinose/galactoside ABC-type transport system permease subunit